MLATVRRSNCTCGFPACSFHEDAYVRDASEGINSIKFTSPYSPYIAGPGKVPPTPIAPALAAVRPDAMGDPAVESVEELSDVDALVVITPRRIGLNCAITSEVDIDKHRRVRSRTWSLKLRIDFSVGYA
jgi:hypothetical protein